MKIRCRLLVHLGLTQKRESDDFVDDSQTRGPLARLILPKAQCARIAHSMDLLVISLTLIEGHLCNLSIILILMVMIFKFS